MKFQWPVFTVTIYYFVLLFSETTATIYELNDDNFPKFAQMHDISIVAFYAGDKNPVWKELEPVIGHVSKEMEMLSSDYSVAIGVLHTQGNLKTAHKVAATEPVNVRLFSKRLNYPKSIAIYEHLPDTEMDLTSAYLLGAAKAFLESSSSVKELDSKAVMFGEAVVENSIEKGEEILEQTEAIANSYKEGSILRMKSRYYISIMKATLEHGAAYLSRFSNTLEKELAKQSEILAGRDMLQGSGLKQKLIHIGVLLRNQSVLQHFTAPMFEEDVDIGDECTDCETVSFPIHVRASDDEQIVKENVKKRSQLE